MSQLKPFHGTETTRLDLPPNAWNNEPQVQPLTILDWKQATSNSPAIVLVQWNGLFPEDTTWETLPELLVAYPDLHLEDKVVFPFRGDVTAPSDEVQNQGPNEEPTHEEATGPMPQIRAKRTKLKPKWLKDYELP